VRRCSMVAAIPAQAPTAEPHQIPEDTGENVHGGGDQAAEMPAGLRVSRGQPTDSPAAQSESRQSRRNLESEPVMPQLNVFVGGMSCRRCVREVTARLRDVPGVETISADPRDRLVRLSGSMELAHVLAAFTGTTYRPRLDAIRSSDSGGTAPGKSAT
jgi:copper chaperone CopZ